MNTHKNTNLTGRRLMNSRPNRTLFPSHINGLRLTNAAGDIDPSSAGYQYMIDTLSYIRSTIIDQKFYEVPGGPATFVPFDVGEGAWSDEIIQNTTFLEGGSFFEGDTANQDSTHRLAEVTVGLDPIRMPTRIWAKATPWTIFEVARAGRVNWDVVSSKLLSLKKNWDLGIQELTFLGHPQGDITGLLNNANVTINTTLITTPISAMTETQFAALVRGLYAAYWTNSQRTAVPDTFVIPSDDYAGLADPVSNSFPVRDKLEYLTTALKKITRNDSFEILPLAYSDSEVNTERGINENRYVLYRRQPDTLKMAVPVDFTMLEAESTNRINWQQAAYGQYSGVLINRPREVLYIDQTP